MFSVAAVCLLALLCALPWGLLLWSLFEGAFGAPARRPGIELLILLGLSALGALGGLLAQISPLGTPQLLLLSAPAWIWLALSEWDSSVWEGVSWHWSVWLLGGLGLALIVVNSAGPAVNGDSGLYHVQAISYLEREGLVKGLGNLHARLAFHSHWFVLNALFHIPRAGGGYAHSLNAVAALLVLFSGLRGASRMMKGELAISSLARAALLLPLIHLAQKLVSGMTILNFLSSPSPDFPVAVCCWLLLIAFTERIEEGSWNKSDAGAAALIWLAAFAVTLKLSALPLLVLIPLIVVFSRNLWLGLLAVPALLVFFAGNAILSGWLIFPGPYGAWPHADWQVPAIYGRMLVSVARDWARMPFVHFDLVDQMSLSQWIGPWWSSRAPFEKGELMLLLGAPLFFALQGPRRGAAPALWLAAMAGVLFWFVTASDPRFGQGFLFIAASAPLLPWAHWAFEKGGRRLSWLLLGLLCVQSLHYLRNDSYRHEWKSMIVSPRPYPLSEPARIRMEGTLKIMETADNQCWDRVELCSCQRCNTPGITRRGEKPRDGFYALGFKNSDLKVDPWFLKPVSARWSELP